MRSITSFTKVLRNYIFFLFSAGLLLTQLLGSNYASVAMLSDRDLWYKPSDSELPDVEKCGSSNTSSSPLVDTLVNSTRLACSPYNTKQWLEAGNDRISNNAEGMDEAYVKLLMEPNLLQDVSKITDQTVCHPNGNFGTGSFRPAKKWNVSDDELIYAWQVKLAYLSLHALLHEPAYEEFRQRIQEPSSGSSCPDIPLFDYECKGAKYVVSTIPDAGFGVSVRLGGVAVVMMALATNRVPLFINNMTNGMAYISKPWPLSGCSRGDYQCVLHPISPCTIRKSELQNATVLKEDQTRPLRKEGIAHSNWKEEKIVVVPSGVMTFRYGRSLQIVKNRLHTKAMELISLYARSSIEDLSENRRNQIDVLTRAAQRIVTTTPDQNSE